LATNLKVCGSPSCANNIISEYEIIGQNWRVLGRV